MVVSNRDDESALLEIKRQLGNPSSLSWWFEGFDYCNDSTNTDRQHSYIHCSSTGRVEVLFLRNFQEANTFPTGICQLTEIIDLTIESSPGFYGPIPDCIGKFPNLLLLTITGTSLTGSIPEFHNQQKLDLINLSNNKLSGTIPESFATLPKLQYLDLSSNYLTGTIPPNLVSLYGSQLVLSNNYLTGEIPKSYGLVDFSMFEVENNHLCGDASFLFGKQKIAIRIMLANNSFEFDLGKVEFSNSISNADLSHNKIYGKVSDSFATAIILYYPNLSSNRLCGELPRGGYMWRYKPEVFANNSCLCGYPLQPCASSAPVPAPF